MIESKFKRLPKHIGVIPDGNRGGRRAKVCPSKMAISKGWTPA